MPPDEDDRHEHTPGATPREAIRALLRMILDTLNAMQKDHAATRAALDVAGGARAEASRRAEADARALARAVADVRGELRALAVLITDRGRVVVAAADAAAADRVAAADADAAARAERGAILDRITAATREAALSRPGAIAGVVLAYALARALGVEHAILGALRPAGAP